MLHFNAYDMDYLVEHHANLARHNGPVQNEKTVCKGNDGYYITLVLIYKEPQKHPGLNPMLHMNCQCVNI